MAVKVSAKPELVSARATTGAASIANLRLSTPSRCAESPPAHCPVAGSQDEPRGLLSEVWGLPITTFMSGSVANAAVSSLCICIPPAVPYGMAFHQINGRSLAVRPTIVRSRSRKRVTAAANVDFSL